jgi:hypothetical protein
VNLTKRLFGSNYAGMPYDRSNVSDFRSGYPAHALAAAAAAAAAGAGEAIRTYSGHHKAITCCALNDSAIDGREADS